MGQSKKEENFSQASCVILTTECDTSTQNGKNKFIPMVKNLFAIGCCTATKKILCFVFAVCYFQQRKPTVSQKFQKDFVTGKN